jgi:hypothetical protein
MDLNAILDELRSERERLQQAIAALERLSAAGLNNRVRPSKPDQKGADESQLQATTATSLPSPFKAAG